MSEIVIVVTGQTGPTFASATTIADAGGYFAATTVEGALQEEAAARVAHIADTVDAHDASAISFAPTGSIAATDVQAAVAEVASESVQASVLTTNGDVLTRAAGVPARITRADLASDSAFTSRYALGEDVVSPPVAALGSSANRRTTMITTFPVGHNWTLGAGWADSTTFPLFGSNSLKLTSSTGTNSNADSPALTPIDFTRKSLVLWLRLTGTVTNIRVFLGNGGFANYMRLDPNIGSDQINEWTPVELCPVTTSRDYVEVGGSFNISAVDRIRIAARSADGGTLDVGGIAVRSAHPLHPNGVVSFSFDDGYASDLTVAAKKLAQYGWVGQSNVIPDILGTGGIATLEQLCTLRDVFGWTVCGQAYESATDTSWAAWTSSQVNTELDRINAWEAANGFGSRVFATPTGAYSATMRAEIKKRYEAIRTTGLTSMPSNTTWPVDPYLVRSMSFNGGITAATAKTAIDQAKAFGGLCVFSIHDLSTAAAAFGEVVDYCAAQEVAVLRLDEALIARRLTLSAR